MSCSVVAIFTGHIVVIQQNLFKKITANVFAVSPVGYDRGCIAAKQGNSKLAFPFIASLFPDYIMWGRKTLSNLCYDEKI
jgi:hypothetical protein